MCSGSGEEEVIAARSGAVRVRREGPGVIGFAPGAEVSLDMRADSLASFSLREDILFVAGPKSVLAGDD
jgi:hypothetical protein